MSTTYIRLDKAIGWVLGTSLSALVLLYIVYRNRDTLLNNKRWTAIIGLSVLSLFLLWLIGAIKRYHERTVKEANELYERTIAEASTNYKSRARTIERLSYVNGLAQEIDHRFWPDKKDVKPSKEEIDIWCGFLTTALHDSFGSSGIAMFTYNNPEAMKVPDEPYLWFRITRERLSKLISEQMQAQLVSNREIERK